MSCPQYPPLVNNDGDLSWRHLSDAKNAPLLLQMHDDFASITVRWAEAWSVDAEDCQGCLIILQSVLVGRVASMFGSFRLPGGDMLTWFCLLCFQELQTNVCPQNARMPNGVASDYHNPLGELFYLS